MALLVGVAFQALSLYVIEPFLGKLIGDIPDVRVFRPLVGDVTQLFIFLGISWTFAAFVEEMIYRGYFMHRFADLFNRNKTGWVVGIILSNLLFGFGHTYQGLSGMIITGITGFVFAWLRLSKVRLITDNNSPERSSATIVFSKLGASVLFTIVSISALC